MDSATGACTAKHWPTLASFSAVAAQLSSAVSIEQSIAMITHGIQLLQQPDADGKPGGANELQAVTWLLEAVGHVSAADQAATVGAPIFTPRDLLFSTCCVHMWAVRQSCSVDRIVASGGAWNRAVRLVA